MKVRVGVVCTSQRDALVGRRTSNADGYLVCGDGQTAWLDGNTERTEAGSGAGALLAVADGEGDDAEAAQTASTSLCRVLAKLWQGEPPRDPTAALGRFLLDAHTRLYWKVAERDTKMGASCAVGWLLGDRLHWAEVGHSRWLLWRKGALTRVGSAWPEADSQRFIAGSTDLGDDTTLHLRPNVNLGVLRLREGDQLLAVTDGYWRTVDDLSTSMLMQHVDDAQTQAVALMERAISRGATDNVTVVVVDLRATVRDVAGATPVVVRHDAPPVRGRWRNLTTEQ